MDFSGVTEDGGEVKSPSSHYGIAIKLNVGDRKTPAEFFDRGFVQGAVTAAFGKNFDVEQTESIAMGSDVCCYKLTAGGSFDWAAALKTNDMPSFCDTPARALETSVDEDTIVNTLAGLDLSGNDKGIIPAFGVNLTRMYADYYNKISFNFEKELVASRGSTDLATILLVEAGHICGFFTMCSDEWYGLVKPMLSTKEDWIHGITACINALGWGVWRVMEVNDQKMVMRVYRGYESLGHLRWFGKADHPVEYLATGVSAAIMNLLYRGDIESRPELTPKLYQDLFQTGGGYKGKQTKCLAAGDDYTEIEVTLAG